jgi:hypothetical protein
MRASRFALVLFAGFATATMAQTPQGSPDVIQLPAPVTSVALSATYQPSRSSQSRQETHALGSN